MSMEDAPEGQVDRPQPTAVTKAFARTAAAIDAMPDPHQAFERATQLASELRDLADKAAELRARTVERIFSAEEMSLAGLAGRIGVSKARADQLLKQARAKKENPDV